MFLGEKRIDLLSCSTFPFLFIFFKFGKTGKVLTGFYEYFAETYNASDTC